MASKARIKESLIRQLKQKGADVEFFRSLIDDYLWYDEQEKEMKKDIKIRGRTYKAYSSSGNEYDKDNPSVKNAANYNKQKLAILKQMGLSTENVIAPSEGKDDNENL